MDGGNSRKRKRSERKVESQIIVGQSSRYHLAEDRNQLEFSKRVCVATQQLSGPSPGTLGVRQQLTVDACTGSVQPLQTAHSAFTSTATTEISELGSKHGRSGNAIVGQVCFGMVSTLKSCNPVPQGSIFTTLDASSLYLYSLIAFLFFVSNPMG